MEIAVYKAEKEDGLEVAIKSNASIAFDMAIEKFDRTYSGEAYAAALSSAQHALGHETDIDLYLSRSVLVSTIWNLNDDIFDKAEAWLARNTPVHKPSNLNHNEKKIVGHLTAVWPVDEEGIVIADTTAIDDLPDVYHLMTSSVIYKHWNDKEYKKEVEELIADIEAGNMSVSMECLFAGFDYGVISPDGLQHVVARGPESAFLTKHLRAYGGAGEYEGHKLGRVLRRITFSGKGYTKKPANPKSITLAGSGVNFTKANTANLTQDGKIKVFANSGVLSNNEQLHANKENDMSDTINKSLEDQNTKLVAKIEELTSALAAKDVKGLEAQVADLNAKLEASAKTAAAEADKAAAVAKELAETKTAAAEAAAKLAEVTEAKAKLETEMNAIKTETLKANRVSGLVDKGVDKAEAETLVAKFVSLNDDEFGAIAELAVAAKAKPFVSPEDKKKADEKKKAEKAKADEEALENVEAEEEAPLSATAEALDDMDSTRAELAKWVKSNSKLVATE